jgi:CheY-like chemotaxis protein
MSQKRILLIDDEPMVSDAFAKPLRLLGNFEVTVINKVKEIYTHLESTETYDLILLDLMMEDTDGFEILQTLRKDENKYQIEGVPVVILTNVSSDEAQKTAQELNVAGYLVKTDYPAKKLVDKINQILNLS